MIDKTFFCEAMETIQLQMLQDREIGDFFSITSGSSLNGTVSYNNNRVIKLCMKFLQQYFPKDEHGHCEIEDYCFLFEFGKPLTEKDEVETFEQLYKRLVNNL